LALIIKNETNRFLGDFVEFEHNEGDNRMIWWWYYYRNSCHSVLLYCGIFVKSLSPSLTNIVIKIKGHLPLPWMDSDSARFAQDPFVQNINAHSIVFWAVNGNEGNLGNDSIHKVQQIWHPIESHSFYRSQSILYQRLYFCAPVQT